MTVLFDFSFLLLPYDTTIDDDEMVMNEGMRRDIAYPCDQLFNLFDYLTQTRLVDSNLLVNFWK